MEITKTNEKRAIETLKRYSTNQDLLDHVTAVAKSMRYFAPMFGEDEKKWTVISILHGLAYEKFYDMRGQKSAEIFERERLLPEQIHAIEAHGFGSFTTTKPATPMEHVFIIVDQMTGIALSCAIL